MIKRWFVPGETVSANEARNILIGWLVVAGLLCFVSLIPLAVTFLGRGARTA